MTKELTEASIAAIPEIHREFLNYCINGERASKIANFYRNPSSVLLVVNDDDIPTLGQVSNAVVKWNRAVGAYHLARVEGASSLPFFYFVGFLDPSKTTNIYDAIDSNLKGESSLTRLLGDQDVTAGRIKLALPLKRVDLDPLSLIVHAQDLRLLGSGTTGSRLVGLMNEAKANGRLTRLHFVLPWSSLASGRSTNPSIDEFRTAEQFYVMMAPKEYSEVYESNGPALIRDALKALSGELLIVNRSFYKGELTSF